MQQPWLKIGSLVKDAARSGTFSRVKKQYFSVTTFLEPEFLSVLPEFKLIFRQYKFPLICNGKHKLLLLNYISGCNRTVF